MPVPLLSFSSHQIKVFLHNNLEDNSCYHIVQRATSVRSWPGQKPVLVGNLAPVSKHIVIWLRDLSHVTISYRSSLDTNVHNGNFSPNYGVWCRRTTLSKTEKSLNVTDSESKVAVWCKLKTIRLPLRRLSSPHWMSAKTLETRKRPPIYVNLLTCELKAIDKCSTSE